MVKYGPYLEAAGPASIETFFYGTERNRNENLSTYIAAKEVALQELESHLGEKLPSRIAGRILLKHANLSDAQKEAMAVRYNALLSFDQAAAALRPLDRPDALVQKVTKTYLTAQDYGGDEDDEEEELLPADAEEPEDEEGPESDGQGNMTFLMFDPQEEYTEEEATYIWAYNSACKDVRRELQARRKGRQFFKKGNTPPVQKKGKNKGFQRRGFGQRPATALVALVAVEVKLVAHQMSCWQEPNVFPVAVWATCRVIALTRKHRRPFSRTLEAAASLASTP